MDSRSNLNQCLLEGILAKNPELFHTDKGTPVCRFIIASQRYYMLDGEINNDVNFFTIEAREELGTNCAGVLKKGRGVRIIGRLQEDRWPDHRGRMKSKIVLVADHVIFKPE